MGITMELRTLRYFQAVAEELSFSRASDRLHIAQPALSRAVKELEDELGAALLARNKHRVRLTAAGSVLLRETGLLLGLAEEAVRKVRRTALGQEGELRIGYIGPPTRDFLAGLLRDFRAKHPRVTLILEERTPERVWEMVLKGRLDIGLTRPVTAGERLGLETLLLREEPLCAVLPPEHPLADGEPLEWTSLRGRPLIVLARREGVGLHDRVLLGCQKAGFPPTLAHTPSIVGTVLTYVEAGAGIGVVPSTVATLDEGNQLVFKPLHPPETVPLVLVWNREEDNPVAESFRSTVRDWLKERGPGSGRK